MSYSAGSDSPGTTDRVDSTEAVLIMVRHGQTDLNRERAFRGHTEAPFNYFWRLELENGAVSSFSFNERDGFVLDSWNRTISSPDGPS